ncbi:extracellular solute-binding protein, partial [Candidatus Uhrbacteria bacterium]|nr:extracellular solute-binding protein [Candidatus Uhrbacteria bacterium]
MKRFPRALLTFLALSLLVLPGIGCRGGSKEAKQALEPVDLTVWRVFDDSDSFRGVIDAYKRVHPNVRINYKKLRFDEYEDALIQALAEDRGPDIFVVHNTWMKKYLPLI